MHSLSRLLSILIVVAVLPASLMARSHDDAPRKRKSKGRMGLRIGQIGGMTFTLESEETGASSQSDIETDAGLTVGLFVEYPLHRIVRTAIALDVYQIKFLREDEYALDISWGAKLHFANKRGTFAFRPGAALGFALMPEIMALEKSYHLTFKTTGELAHFVGQKGLGILFELGAVWSLHGSDGDYDIKAGPGLLVRFGILF